MQEKIDNFKVMSLEKQKEILLIVMSKSIDKSDGIKKLYDVVNSVDTYKELDVIKQEFIKIYTFLMEAVNYIDSINLNKSFNRLDKIRNNEMEESYGEDNDNILEKQLQSL